MLSPKKGTVREDGYVYSGRQWYSPDTMRRRRITAFLIQARNRAKEEGVPFALTLDYVDDLCKSTPICPIMRVPLIRGSQGGRDNSPSIDRIRPELGYVPDNVRCISQGANRIKGGMSPEQVARLAAYVKGEL